MNYDSTRFGFFSRSNACVLIAASAAWLSASQLHAETIAGGSDVEGNFTVGNTTAKGKLVVNAPQSVTSDLTVLGLQVNSAGGVYFAPSAVTSNPAYVPAINSGFYFSASVGSIQLGNFTPGENGWTSISNGYHSIASGSQSVAIGYMNLASGATTAAFGEQTVASGNQSAAFGYSTDATGAKSFSAGDYSLASGVSSFAAGTGVTANSLSSAVFGAFNKVPTVSATAWVDGDPLFTIGNGTADNQRSSALMVQKDGIMNLYPFGSASASIVLNPKGTPSITVGGQKVLTADANGYIATPTNGLSIGARNPTVPTDKKTIELNAGGYGAPAAYNTASNGDKLILFRDAAASYDATIGVGSSADMWFKSSGTGGGMFRWYTGNSVTNSMVLDSSGRLGIGTSSPTAPLTISANVDAQLTLVRNTGSNNWNYIDFYDGATRKWVLGQSNAAGAFTIYNQALGQQVFNVTTGGNVGIGTTTPLNKLQVGGGSGTVYTAINGGNSGNTGGAALRIQNGGVDVGALGNLSALNGGAYNSTLVLGSTGALWLGTNGLGTAPKLVIDTSGNVGVGTSTATAKFEVAGTVKFTKQGDIPMGEFGTNGD